MNRLSTYEIIEEYEAYLKRQKQYLMGRLGRLEYEIASIKRELEAIESRMQKLDEAGVIIRI